VSQTALLRTGLNAHLFITEHYIVLECLSQTYPFKERGHFDSKAKRTLDFQKRIHRINGSLKAAQLAAYSIDQLQCTVGAGLER